MFNKKIKFIAFSLIELMITIAIIGVLATIAIPSYESYLIRARVVEGLGVLDQLKQMSVDFYNQNGALPNSINDLNLASNAYSTNNIWSIFIVGQNLMGVGGPGIPGTLVVEFNPHLVPSFIPSSPGGVTDTFLNLVPSINGSIITWQCGSQSVAQSYLPANCTSGLGFY